MSDQERENIPLEPTAESWDLGDAPPIEEVLSERLSEAADAVTGELDDLKASLSLDEPEVEVPEAEATDLAAVGPEALELELPQATESFAAPEAEAPSVAPQVTPKPAPEPAPEISNDDRLLSALAWLTLVILQLPIVSIIQLLSAANKERPFQKHHAVTSLLFFAAAIVYEIVAGIAYGILGLVTLGIGYICLWPLFFVPHLFGLYFALQAYNGKRIELPILSDLGRNQGWL